MSKATQFKLELIQHVQIQLSSSLASVQIMKDSFHHALFILDNQIKLRSQEMVEFTTRIGQQLRDILLSLYNKLKFDIQLHLANFEKINSKLSVQNLELKELMIFCKKNMKILAVSRQNSFHLLENIAQQLEGNNAKRKEMTAFFQNHDQTQIYFRQKDKAYSPKISEKNQNMKQLEHSLNENKEILRLQEKYLQSILESPTRNFVVRRIDARIDDCLERLKALETIVAKLCNQYPTLKGKRRHVSHQKTNLEQFCMQTLNSVHKNCD